MHEAEGFTRPDWFPDWSGETTILVASGPSAVDVDLEIAKGKSKVIVINNSWKLAPWADCLYACDHEWWAKHDGCTEFQGMRMSADHHAIEQFGLFPFYCSRRDDRVNMNQDSQHIGWGGNSGFGALNIAMKFRAKRVLLVGYDMNVDGGSHWHGLHPEGLHNPTHGNTVRWRRALDLASEAYAQIGMTIINCSPVSSLVRYPKLGFEDAFRGADPAL